MKPKLLILTHDFTQKDKAPHINTAARKKVLTRIGFKITLYNLHPKGNNFLRLVKIIRRFNVIYIRIDGSGCLDKYSLLKFFNRNCALIWEVHGCLEEQLVQSRKFGTHYKVFLVSILRKILSSLVSKYVFVSNELADFCILNHKLVKRQYFVIPNFIENISEGLPKFPEFRSLFSKDAFIVLWVGNPSYKWHAIDLIEKIARIVYSVDTSVLFILVGGKSWHNFHWHKNIILLEPMDSDALSKFLSTADICLALYNKNKSFPSYFSSLKILQYMKYRKAIIASNTKTIKTMLDDGKNGLITNGTAVDVANKIILLKRDQKLRYKLGDQALRSLTKNHNSEIAFAQYLDLLHSL